jgi:hypothetical protein
MIQWILGGIQSLMNFLFLIVVLGTAGLSWWLSIKYKERFAEFPWHKAGILLGIEVVVWIGFNIFWGWFMHNWWIVAIVVAVILIILSRKKKNPYAI